ncbi:MAG: hypothetical protein HGA29_03620 [Syntrophaceae bacterium]|nr:hypothetical protein [Syntrophaceae bacterium]
MPKKMGAKLDKQSIENLKAGLKEYNNIISKLQTIDKVVKAPLRIKRDLFTKMGREEKRILLRDKINEACKIDAFGDLDKLIGLIHQSYNLHKAQPGTELNTHQYITDQAIALIGIDPAIADTLHTYCTYPDEPKSDMSDLIFEGHFYGKTSSGTPGNYLVDAFPDATLKAMEFIKKIRHGVDEDIHENAVMNFTRYFNQVLHSVSADQKHFYLGVAAHFLQDLTAPHHAGNYPALPYVDHYFFEKFTSQYVYDEPGYKISRPAYKNFKAKLTASPAQPEPFALEITGMAAPFIQYIETAFHHMRTGEVPDTGSMDKEIDKLNKCLLSGENEDWEKAIVGAIPLAVYATAYLFETSLA